MTARRTQAVVVGDCVEVMRGMEPDSIDAIVTDPPYGLEFMGKEWDRFPVRKRGMGGSGYESEWAGGVEEINRSPAAVREFQRWCEAWATEALRVLKPGAHLLAFGGPRTFHRLTCGIEDAGFEIRDCLSWLFGSGFPKSKNLGDGRGTALKPGWEPCVVARKPLIGTVAANVERYGTGALNIDACRIEANSRALRIPHNDPSLSLYSGGTGGSEAAGSIDQGRWPANVALGCACAVEHDTGCAVAMLDAQSGERGGSGIASGPTLRNGNVSVARGKYNGLDADTDPAFYGDTGGASRFFYTAKASRSEREAWGRLTLPAERRTDGRAKDIENPRLRTSPRVNTHPTVKPLALMEWLIKLVLPSGGVLLDPFAGSGSTLVAARRLNVQAIGIEQDERSAAIAEQRIAAQWEVQLL